MRNAKTILICKDTIRRENEDDSDRRGTEIAASDIYAELVKGCVADRGPGRF